MISTGTTGNTPVPHQREHRPEHEHLVGQRVEEGARAWWCRGGGPGSRRSASVDESANHSDSADHEPSYGPLRLVIMANRIGDSQHAADGDGVGPRGQGVGVVRRSLMPSRRSDRGRPPGTLAAEASTARVRPHGVDHLDPGERAHGQMLGHLDDAVDLRAPPGGCGPTPGASTSTSDVVPISSVAAGGGDGVLQLAQLGQALGHQRQRATLPSSVGGVGAVLPE